MSNEQVVRNENEFKTNAINAGIAKSNKQATKQKPALYLAKSTPKKVVEKNPHFLLKQNTAKRIFDVVLSGSLLVVSIPLLVLIAVAIRLSSKGPIVLKQIRLTDGGRKFAMYKFRSMTVDAETPFGTSACTKE